MKAKKLYFMECHVAGRQYHDADEVWEELKVGAKVRLVREKDNRFDPHAVAIVYYKRMEGEEEAYLLGYVPRGENETIAGLLEMGWTDVFECRISRINATVHYEDQIHVTIRLVENVSVKG